MATGSFVAGGWWAAFPGKGSFTRMDVKGIMAGEVESPVIMIEYDNTTDWYIVIAVEGSCITLGKMIYCQYH